MTGSGNNGLPQPIEPSFDASFVLAFFGHTRSLGDEVCERVNRVEKHPESSMADD